MSLELGVQESGCSRHAGGLVAHHADFHTVLFLAAEASTPHSPVPVAPELGASKVQSSDLGLILRIEEGELLLALERVRGSQVSLDFQILSGTCLMYHLDFCMPLDSKS